ncbi:MULTISPECIES: nitrogen regulation protein NR(II) [unclassified Aureimonas]|uniref:two-component system sensor histidine kinase NtrB n=1 Tax=unclassified Aureimonas TaxID=2615206 RepID=UPI00071F3527|nr:MULTISPECIES: nitrogen regulation protein NR(II) [unclassified Aureimonas]ALN73307.1 hypothetical protein M673_11310 [Aureimonas sp. AU20]
MTSSVEPSFSSGEMGILNALPHPVFVLGPENEFASVNSDAEQFFSASAASLARKTLGHFIPHDSPIFGLIEQVRLHDSRISEYRVDVSSPRLGGERLVDVYVSSLAEAPGHVVVMVQLRSIADKMDRQLTHRSAARTVTGLAAMLAHEIRNPLSGIKGAAQLLEASANDDDRVLTRLIQEESDRIVKLVDRMEVFSDQRPIERSAVNIHSVLEHVKTLAKSGFARGIRIQETYDPSLPPVFANRDQLIQVFLNLLKNASEALAGREDGEIRLSTAFRPGVRLSVPGTKSRVTLPLEFIVEDNGVGVPQDIREHIFDPFVTTKPSGTGLGLALVAKIVGDHGGVIECESQPGHTSFRILMPAWADPTSPDTTSHRNTGKRTR